MKQPLAWIIFIFLALTWGSSFILIKKGLEVFSPLQVATLRVVIAAAVLQPLLLGKAKKVEKGTWKYIIMIGVLGNGLPAFLFPIAQEHINSATAGVLNSLSPVFVLIFGLLFFGLSFSVKQGIGVILGFMGALLLTLARGASSAPGGEVNPFESLGYSGIVVIATMCYGLSTIIMKKYLSQMNSVLATGFALSVAAVPYVIYLITASGIPEVLQENPEAWQALGYLFILGAIGTALAVVLFYQLIKMTEAIIAASVTYAIPLVALGWGLAVGESFSYGQMLGIAITLVGVYLVNRK
ncbi:MAG: DMT family transporter [Bacteroidia bacterium]|nr:DMT family transporter [Bacteroidia bacterium]